MTGLLHRSTTASRSTPRVRLMVLAVACCVLTVAISARPAFSDTGGTLLAAAGFMLVVLAALGRLWTSLFIAGFKDATLVRHGPYAACRHPLYALSFIGMLGLGLGSRSVVLALTLVAITLALHGRALAAEDRLLESLHGDDARRYRATVPALWPHWAKYAVPSSLEIRPQVVWKAVLDAASLLLAFELLEVAHVLQRAGVTPTLLVLP